MESNIEFSWHEIVKKAIDRRKEQKLSQEELSVLAGVSKPTLNDFEQGRTSVTISSVLKILIILGLAK